MITLLYTILQISYNDFKYWKLCSTIEKLAELEKSCDYPPRFQVRCGKNDATATPHFSFALHATDFEKDKSYKIADFLYSIEMKGMDSI